MTTYKITDKQFKEIRTLATLAVCYVDTEKLREFCEATRSMIYEEIGATKTENDFEKMTDAEFVVEMAREIQRRSINNNLILPVDEKGFADRPFIQSIGVLSSYMTRKETICCEQSDDPAYDVTMGDGSVLHVSNPRQTDFPFHLNVER